MYMHKVQYYETDKMGVVHHSNYIRWFEEARGAYMEDRNYPYENIENKGMCVPVLSVECEYKKSTRYGETVEIDVKLVDVGNVRHKFIYEVRECKTKELRATGYTTHCLLDENGRPVSIKRKEPELYKLLMENIVEGGMEKSV